MLGYGLAFWLPSLMQRSFGLDLIETAQFYGGVLVLGGVAGVLLGGVLGDRMGARDRRMYARIPAIAFVIAVPLFAAGILSSSATFLLVNNLIGLGGGSFALGALSDSLSAHYGDEALRYAMLIGLVLYLVAALLMWIASTPLRRDWVDQSI